MGTGNDPRTAELLENTRWLLRLARRLVGANEAEDLVQEVLVASWSSPRLPLGSQRAWLGRVARRLASSLHRRTGARRARERVVARAEAEPAPTPLEQAELQRVLLDAVLALDEPYRATVLARFVEGLDVDAIARREGVAASSIRSRLTRAYEPLRRRLDGQFGGRERWALLAAPAPALAPGPTAIALGSFGGWLALGALASVILLTVLALREVGSRPAGAPALLAGEAPSASPSPELRPSREPTAPRPEPSTTARPSRGVRRVPTTPWSGPWSLTGTVRLHGQPVPGAAVLWADESGTVVPERLVTTDGAGRYVVRFADEAEARSARRVVVRMEGLLGFPNPIRAFEDGVAHVDLYLDDGLPFLIEVRDEDGRPLENVELSLAPRKDVGLSFDGDPTGDDERTWRRVLKNTSVAHGRTDARGECRLAVIPTRRGRLTAWKEGYRLLLLDDLSIDPSRRVRRVQAGEDPSNLPPDPRPAAPPPPGRDVPRVLSIVMERGDRDPLVLRLVDANGVGVSGAHVRLEDLEAGLWRADDGTGPWRTSDEDGRVVLAEFASGRRYLFVEADVPGFAALRANVPEHDPRWPEDGELVLVVPRPTSVELTLVDPDGRPIEDRWAELQPDDPIRDPLDAVARTVSIAPGGRARWTDVPDTCGDLWLFVPRFEPALLTWAARARGVGTGEPLVLTPARTWTVDVRAAGTDAPIPDAGLEVVFERTTATGSRIQKRIELHPRPGESRIAFDSTSLMDAGGTLPVECRFRAGLEGYAIASWTRTNAELRAGPAERTVRLEPSGD